MTPQSKMKLLRTIIGFFDDDPQSLRFEATARRVRSELGELRYMTIADSKREMRGDVERLRRDFHNAIREASDNGKVHPWQ